MPRSSLYSEKDKYYPYVTAGVSVEVIVDWIGQIKNRDQHSLSAVPEAHDH